VCAVVAAAAHVAATHTKTNGCCTNPKVAVTSRARVADVCAMWCARGCWARSPRGVGRALIATANATQLKRGTQTHTPGTPRRLRSRRGVRVACSACPTSTTPTSEHHTGSSTEWQARTRHSRESPSHSQGSAAVEVDRLLHRKLRALRSPMTLTSHTTHALCSALSLSPNSSCAPRAAATDSVGVACAGIDVVRAAR
jgi:hypothetical protein